MFKINKRLFFKIGLGILILLLTLTLIYFGYTLGAKSVGLPVTITGTYQAPCDFSEEGLLIEINKARMKPVKIANDLDGYAQKRAVESYTVWNHESFLDGGARYMTNYRKFGENLYRGPVCYSAEIVRLWLESPTHREVMEDKDYEFVGIGVYQDRVSTVYGKLK